MNNDNEKSPRHFLKIPDGKLSIHFIRPYRDVAKSKYRGNQQADCGENAQFAHVYISDELRCHLVIRGLGRIWETGCVKKKKPCFSCHLRGAKRTVQCTAVILWGTRHGTMLLTHLRPFKLCLCLICSCNHFHNQQLPARQQNVMKTKYGWFGVKIKMQNSYSPCHNTRAIVYYACIIYCIK